MVNMAPWLVVWGIVTTTVFSLSLSSLFVISSTRLHLTTKLPDHCISSARSYAKDQDLEGNHHKTWPRHAKLSHCCGLTAKNVNFQSMACQSCAHQLSSALFYGTKLCCLRPTKKVESRLYICSVRLQSEFEYLNDIQCFLLSDLR